MRPARCSGARQKRGTVADAAVGDRFAREPVPVVAGWISASLYKQMTGEKWVWATIMTAGLVPGTLWGTQLDLVCTGAPNLQPPLLPMPTSRRHSAALPRVERAELDRVVVPLDAGAALWYRHRAGRHLCRRYGLLVHQSRLHGGDSLIVMPTHLGCPVSRCATYRRSGLPADRHWQHHWQEPRRQL